MISKTSGGQRQLGIPTVKDRLVQQAISQVLSKRYEPIFSDHSYGFRPKRSAHGALHKAGSYVAEGKKWIVDLDLEKFFDMVNHDRLMWLLGTRIGDKTLLRLIGRFLRAGMLKGGLAQQRIQGTPQGSPLSPLLSNIVLDELDKTLEQRGHSFVRYADDLIILVSSEEAAKRVLSSTTRLIEERLRLKVNREKSEIRKPYAVNFLGHSFLTDGRLGISRQSISKFKAKIKQVTKRNRGISLKQLVKELNPILRGWLGYFRYATMRKRLEEMASWVNRKIRCFRLKQCKRAIGIARFLHQLGVSWKRSWRTAGSSKGWHRLSNSPAVNEGMNLKWIRSIGLYDLNANYALSLKETAQYDKRTLGGVRGQQG
jgi:group II intron reverse transcriptase/maturase